MRDLNHKRVDKSEGASDIFVRLVKSSSSLGSKRVYKSQFGFALRQKTNGCT